MALVQVARILDITEAQVVTSALRSAGIFVMVQSESLAQSNASLLQAMGGLAVMVPDEEADAARAFIEAHRCRPSTLAPLPRAEMGIRAILSLLLTSTVGMLLPLRPRRPGRLAD